MNILFLTPRDSGKYLGGVEGHVRILTRELVKRGHNIKEIALDESIKVTPCSARSHLFKLQAWGYLWGKRDLFRWAEVIHVHDVFWWYAPFAVINKCLALLRQQGRALVSVTFHGWEGVCPPTRSAVWQKRVASFLSNGTIGVGDFFKKWYGVRPDRIVWGVVEDKLINRQIDKSTNRQIKNLKIIFLGRMEKVNGVEVVVEALEKLANKQIYKYTNRQIDKLRQCVHRIIFVGDGNYRKQAEKFGKVTGMVKNPQKYLVSADLVIASSYMSMLEAATMGKPIIAVANSKLKNDYLNYHPLRKYIMVARNAMELIDEIKKLKINKDWEKRGKRWAVGQTAERLADVYEGLWRRKR